MFDLLDLTLNFALSQAAVARLAKELPFPLDKLYKRELRSDRWATKVVIQFDSKCIRLRFCPNKVLGQWNARGSDDLRDLVRIVVPLILQEVGHVLTARQVLDIRWGRFRLHEVHIAYSFYLLHADQRAFVTKVGSILARQERVEWLHPGFGVRVFPRSRTVEYLLYAKLHETATQGRKRMGKLIADLGADEQPWSRAAFVHQLNYAAAGPRLEIRLRDKFFRPSGNRRPSPYDSGRNWAPNTAHQLFCAKLLQLDLPDAVRAVPDRVLAEARLDPAVLKTFLLWAADEDLRQLMAPTTFRSHQRAIAEALGIDIRHPSAEVFGAASEIPVGSVLCAANIVAPNFDPDDWGCEELAFQYRASLARNATSKRGRKASTKE